MEPTPEWFGRLGEGWNFVRLDSLVERRNLVNRGPITTNVLSVVAGRGVINYEDKGDIGNKKSEDIERYQVVYPGDLVLNSMNVIIGSVGISSEHGSLSPVYLVLKPKRRDVLSNRYLGYIFDCKSFQRSLVRLGYGILSHRMRIPWINLKKELIPYVHIDTQEAIANFLDRKTAAIDALIEKKERLIELLEEKRQALITRAVTKGLDHNVPMKDSGIEWLGEIPEHWEVVRSKALFRERSGRSEDGTEELLTVSHITGVTPRSEKNVYMFEAESNEGYKLVNPSDLAINTMWAWMGALGISAHEGIVSPSYNVYSPTFEQGAWYYDYLFRSPPFIPEIIRWSKGIWTSRLRLYPNEFGRIMLPAPPEDERIAIAEYVTKVIEHDLSLIHI